MQRVMPFMWNCYKFSTSLSLSLFLLALPYAPDQYAGHGCAIPQAHRLAVWGFHIVISCL
uniref:Uncharacterized protein n=1 Tax=Anguilla anguilla TaxID=7936 RepID=A0A0E9XPE3_ANGAN